MGGSDLSTADYAAVTVESSQARIHGEYSPARVRAGLRKRSNWEQLVRFCVVGGSGYVVNLAVFAFLLEVVGLHYISAAVGSFLVAVTNNYTWNRLWTFRSQRGGFAYQGTRFFLVSTLALLANLAVLHLFVTLGVGEKTAQAIAIVLVTPVNFVGNKLWSFGPRR
jgi:dolichol-phosphate mannosyltransferase